MKPFDEALRIMLESAIQTDSEKTTLPNSIGRILAEDIFADADSPGFNKSAMDGYAIRKEDLALELEVIEVVPAGIIPKKRIGKKQCAKIMTGAMIPQGADTVLMVEDTKLTSEGKMTYTKLTEPNVCDTNVKINTNIRVKGEDCRKGDLLIKKGTWIKPQHIAIMASVGQTEPFVFKRIKVGVITTGTEVVEPHIAPEEGQIRNTNSMQLMSQLHETGALSSYYGIVPDDENTLKKKAQKALSENDIIIFTGGMSKGDFDFVPQILKSIGFELLFRQVAVQPGKPTMFGRSGQKFCIGLPGNPVSAFIQFELMAKPFILTCMGNLIQNTSIQIEAGEVFSRKKDKRKGWIPVLLKDNRVVKADYNGSGHINSFANAWGIAALPVGVKTINEGELIETIKI